MGNTVWLGTFHRETEWNRTHVDKVKVSDELPAGNNTNMSWKYSTSSFYECGLTLLCMVKVEYLNVHAEADLLSEEQHQERVRHGQPYDLLHEWNQV